MFIVLTLSNQIVFSGGIEAFYVASQLENLGTEVYVKEIPCDDTKLQLQHLSISA